MKKILCLCLCTVVLLSLGVVFASATPGFYCGGDAENFTPVGNIEIMWDIDVSAKIDLCDGEMWDWETAGYSPVEITPDNMISWLGGSDENQAGGVPEGWGVQAYFVADPDCLYIGFRVTDPDVILVQDADYFQRGDSIQLAVDFDYALSKFMKEDPDLFPDDQCIFYSFGPMGEEPTPIQIKVECNDDPGIMSEAKGDHVKGSTFKIETGWCAEFAIGWDELYGDFAYKAYADDYECSVYEGDPLELGMCLYYLNNDLNKEITWAAGTLAGDHYAAAGMPDVTWKFEDIGMHLYLPYRPGMKFSCRNIVVCCATPTPPPVTEPVTEPEPEETKKEDDVVIEYSTFIFPGDMTGEWYTFVMGDGSIVNGEFYTFVMGNGSASLRPNPNDPPSNGGQDGMIVINCASTLTPAVTLVVLSGALLSAWALKKKQNRRDD